jgi:hypothetical protein
MAPTVILVLISFVASATGAVLVRRRLASHSRAPVSLVEVIIIAGGLCLIAALRRPGSITYILLCAFGMSLLGAVTAAAMIVGRNSGSGGTREYENVPALEQSNTVWKHWLSFTRSVAEYEVRLLLVICYLLLIGPIAMARHFRAKELTGGPTSWVARNDEETLDAARRSF